MSSVPSFVKTIWKPSPKFAISRLCLDYSSILAEKSDMSGINLTQ